MVVVVVVEKTQVPLVIAPSIAIPIQYQFVLLPLIFGLSLGLTLDCRWNDNGSDNRR